MGKRNKIITCLTFIVLLLIPYRVKAEEVPTIIYDGTKHIFKIENVDDTDLFADLKGLMPGDTKKQNVQIKLVNMKNPTKFYLESSSSTDLTSYDELTCKVYNGNEFKSDNFIFDPIELGNYNLNQKIDLVLELRLSTSAEYRDDKLCLKWTIKAEENGQEVAYELIDTSDKNGMETNYYIIVILLIFLIVILFLDRIKSKNTFDNSHK